MTEYLVPEQEGRRLNALVDVVDPERAARGFAQASRDATDLLARPTGNG